jgi:predicted DNA-binding protein with PD1-like motif
MKKLNLFLLLILPLTISAQGKKPGELVLTTNFKSVEIIRMGPGTDMLDGLNTAIKEKGIRNAVILAGIGSVTDYHFHVVSDKNLPPAEEFPKASVPMDVVSVQGYVLNGRVHAHLSLSDENSMTGGHLEKGTKALTFFIITIGVLPDSLNMGELDNYRF